MRKIAIYVFILMLVLIPIVSVIAEGNQPPNKPNIDGPNSGNLEEMCNYTISSIDPDGDDVYLYVGWPTSCPVLPWFGPYKSGEEVKFSCCWEYQGTFSIRVKAQDTYGEESEWSLHPVTIGKPKTYLNNNILQIIMQKLIDFFPYLSEILKIIKLI
jgi:hypothetical protein